MKKVPEYYHKAGNVVDIDENGDLRIYNESSNTTVYLNAEELRDWLCCSLAARRNDYEWVDRRD